MKKILTIIISIFVLAEICFAWGGGDPPSLGATPWKSWAVKNETGKYSLTAVDNSIIPKGTAILGYSVMQSNNALHSENVCTIYDGGITSSDEVIGEAEAVNFGKGGEWYPYPRTLEKQIYIHQGPNTVVALYFE